MKYTIEGKNLPVLICELDENETIVSEGGAMSWMSPNMEMKTSTRGGFKKAFGRSLSGERAFQNIYRAKKVLLLLPLLQNFLEQSFHMMYFMEMK